MNDKEEWKLNITFKISMIFCMNCQFMTGLKFKIEIKKQGTIHSINKSAVVVREMPTLVCFRLRLLLKVLKVKKL